MADLIEHQIAAESGGDPYAKNPRSSATGVGQFISSTWMDLMRRYRPDLVQGRSTMQVLGLRTDPALSREMMGHYNAENGATLQGAGFEASPGNLDLAYFAGPAGARAVLGADPNTPVTQLLTPGAVAANPHIRNMSAGDLIAWAHRRGNKGGSAPTQGARAMAKNAISTTEAPMAQQEGFLPQIPDLGDLPSARKKAMAEALMRDAFGSSDKIRSRGGVLARIAQLAAGSYMGGQYEDQVNARNRKMAAALMGAQGNDALIRTLFASGDPDLIKAGVSSRIRTAEGAANRGLTPVPMLNEKTGQVELGTVGGDGTWKPLGGSTGYKPAPRTTQKDTGTEIVTFDVYGNEIGRTKKDVSGEASQKEQGKIAAEARGALNGVKSTVDNALSTLGQLRNHPGRQAGTGLSSWIDPRNYIPGFNAKDFQVKNAQAQSQAFMSAREGLKGAGQVTDFEGKKGEEAIAALTTAQSEDQYLQALDQLERMMNASYEDLKRKASLDQTSTQGTQPARPLAHGDAIDAARNAISQGADKNAVIQRLKERGYDPSGL